MNNTLNRSCCDPTASAHIRHNPAYYTKPGFDYNPADYKRTFRPRVDISEDSTAFYLELELAGIKKNDVKVSVNDEGILTVAGNKTADEAESQTGLRSERKFGEFSRAFKLPKNVDADTISASYNNGVLTLTLPKNKPNETHVEIQ